ncbi:MAG: hypothetical protein QOH19_2491 [Actinomycetota bacterium]|nr:hypothetical protein [Actinomycetota bacterium]
MSADPVTVWREILDGFEADIALAVSGGSPEPWNPPADAGPVPAELAERALRVADAQRETAAILARTKADAAAHLEALDAVPGSRASGHALLLDVRG